MRLTQTLLALAGALLALNLTVGVKRARAQSGGRYRAVPVFVSNDLATASIETQLNDHAGGSELVQIVVLPLGSGSRAFAIFRD